MKEGSTKGKMNIEPKETKRCWMTHTESCPYPFTTFSMASVSNQPALMVAGLLTSVITRTTSGSGCWCWAAHSFLFHVWLLMNRFSKTWLGSFQPPSNPCLLPKGKDNFRAEMLACSLHIPVDPLKSLDFSQAAILLSQGQPGQDG